MTYYSDLEYHLKNFGEIIRQRRLELGLSQYDLALSVWTTQKIISNIENWKYNPTLELFFRIIDYLDISYKIFIN